MSWKKQPLQQVNLAKEYAKNILDTNNSAAASTSTQLLSILEAGEGSSITRNLLDQYLHNMLKNWLHNTVNYQRTTLRKCLSIKEKIAYATGLLYANKSHETINDTTDIDDKTLRNTLDETIRNIEDKLLKNRDFSESWILRNAAVNHFECELTTSETNKLNIFGTKIKKICENEGLYSLAESTHFTHESDAQKILKLSDILIQISSVGIKIDANILEEFEVFEKKIQKIKNLDKHFKHVTKTLNMLHRIAQKWYHAMVRPKQKEKIQKVLHQVGMIEEVNKEMIKFNQIENFDKNEEHGFLDKLLGKVKSQAKFKETIYSMSITEAQFNERFMSNHAFELMQWAKAWLHIQKGETFGDRVKNFESDTQSRRGLVRRRIFDIAEKMIPVGKRFKFSSEEHFNTMNSYFENFRDIFFAKEEDNYWNPFDKWLTKNKTEKHYDNMTKVVSELIRRRVPALASTDRIRKWSIGRKMYKYLGNAFKGKERWFFSLVKRLRHKADDATIIAMVIMAQNEATNQVFYQDEDQDKKADSRRGKLRGKISFAENGRKAIRDRMGPTANKALTFTEEAVKKGLLLSKHITKWGTKIGAKVARWGTYTVGTVTGKFNTMIKKGYKRWKTPLYLPYLLTAPTERAMKHGYKGASYVDKTWGHHIENIGKGVQQGYDHAKDMVGKTTGQETNYLFQWVTYATEQATSLVGKTVAAGGQWMHDTYTTGQKRSILWAFYGAAKKEKRLDDLMQSSELGDMLNLKTRGPRLFDEDGRIVMGDEIEEKEKDSPEEIGKEMAKKFEKQLETLLKQADDENRKLQKELENLEEDIVEKYDKGKERKIERIRTKIWIKNEEKTIIKDIHDEIDTHLVPTLKNPIDWSGNREMSNIKTAIDKITNKLDDGSNKWYIPSIKEEINNWWGKGWEIDVKNAKEKISNTQNIIKEQERIIEREGNFMKETRDNRQKNTANNRIKRAQTELATQEKILQENEIILETASITLQNKRNVLAWLTKINNAFTNLQTLNNNIWANPPTPEQKEQLKKISKNIDLLLYPETEASKETTKGEVKKREKDLAELFGS